ncbi:hypothetical protein L596_011291 [Steinernema carpocapsae]|uniref:Uncharacterized protein n=1 Tax=Steinernema carpocapsae TaxID=34508 RepID=A0A4U5NTY7_STECR|nr:hypothetical protein L596_011291 [Steinernema carpocapsae]
MDFAVDQRRGFCTPSDVLLCERPTSDSNCTNVFGFVRKENLGIQLKDSAIVNDPIHIHAEVPFLWSTVLVLGFFVLLLFLVSFFLTLVTWGSDLPESYFLVYMRDAIVTLSRIDSQALDKVKSVP